MSWGFDPRPLRDTIARYNALVRDGSGTTPGRRWNRIAFGEPPFHAAEARPGITATQGGLRVDGDARVLDRTGAPIPGLFAAGADAGDFYRGGYAGSLSVAAVFGVSAAELTDEQAALLAGAVINPRVYSPGRPNARLLRRQQIILGRMRRMGN